MSAKNVTELNTAQLLAAGWEDGLTPTVQALLDAAVHATQEAIAATERALDAADEGTDAACRCDEALGHLEETLVLLRWTPPAEH